MVSIKKIQNKRSAVKGSVPTASDIEYGEIAINYFDGDEQIFIRNTNTTPTLVNFRTDEQNHNNFVDSSGDTMTGKLIIEKGGLNVIGNAVIDNLTVNDLTITSETTGIIIRGDDA